MSMILVTGGAGYIGSHTVLNLLNCGYDILIFDNLETGHKDTVDELKKYGNVIFEQGDIRNISDCERIFKKYKISAVIHFAAYALVEESVINPVKYYKNNVLGSIHLLNAMINNNVKKIIFSSSCATYGEPKYLPIDENHEQNPVNPYGQTKLETEKIIREYDKIYGLKSIILRYFNVAGCDSKLRIGERHNPETHLIPNILKSINSEKKFKIFGCDYKTFDGTCIRDYVNVEDLADAHRLALEYLNKENTSNIFNLGTEKGNSVQEVFDTCQCVTSHKINVEKAERRPGDPAVLYANAAKAKKILGWVPSRTLEDSIKSAFEFEMQINKERNRNV